LHDGHCLHSDNHLVMHASPKQCPHGSATTRCRPSLRNASKQMLHVAMGLAAWPRCVFDFR
jgi:hypothetical protein